MGGTVAMGLAVGVLGALFGLAAGGMLVAAAVVALQPSVGWAGALGLVAAGLIGLIGLGWAVMAARLRRARARRQAAAPVMAVLGVLEVVLALLPRRRLAQMEAALAAGVTLGTVLLTVLRRDGEA